MRKASLYGAMIKIFVIFAYWRMPPFYILIYTHIPKQKDNYGT